MDVVALHRYLALASVAAVVAVGTEGLVRAAWARAPGALAGWASTLALFAFVMTIAGGLGLFVSGARPKEMLHLVYAALVLAAIPLANSLSAKASPRLRGLATASGAIIALVVVWRLFSTG